MDSALASESGGKSLVGSRTCGLQYLWHTGLLAARHVGSSQTRDWTCVSSSGRRILYHWASWDVPYLFLIFFLRLRTNAFLLGQSPQYLNIVTTFASPSLHSFWSYFSTDLQQRIGHLPSSGVHLSVSYLFAFSCGSWGSQGKNAEVVHHSFSAGPCFVRNPHFGCESWTLKKAEPRRIDAFELWHWRRL